MRFFSVRLLCHRDFIHFIEGMTRAEMLLKVVMSPLEPSAGFVEQYIRLVQVILTSAWSTV